MEKKRVIEVICSLTNERLCKGCQLYGHIDIGCDRCIHIAGVIARKAIEENTKEVKEEE